MSAQQSNLDYNRVGLECLDCCCHHSGGRKQVPRCHSLGVVGCLIEDTQALDGPELVWAGASGSAVPVDNKVWGMLCTTLYSKVESMHSHLVANVSHPNSRDT